LLGDLQQASAALEEATGVDPVGESGPVPGIVSALVSTLAMGTPVFMGQLVVFIALVYFLLESRLRMRAGLLRLCMTRRARLRAAHVFRDAETRVSTYLLTITAINAALGVATSLVMWAIGLPNPLLWGMLAFLLNYAPYLGPGVLIVLLVGAGLVSFDDQGWAFLPALVLLCAQRDGGQFPHPRHCRLAAQDRAGDPDRHAGSAVRAVGHCRRGAGHSAAADRAGRTPAHASQPHPLERSERSAPP
jgi:hypothetical protein